MGSEEKLSGRSAVGFKLDVPSLLHTLGHWRSLNKKTVVCVGVGFYVMKEMFVYMSSCFAIFAGALALG